MAKRARGTGRPGQQAPLQRTRPRPDSASTSAARPAAASRPGAIPSPSPAPATGGRRLAGGLTEDEEARAAQLEAAILAEERSSQETTRRSRERARATPIGPRELAPLAVRATEEYAYVRRDVVAITRIGIVLVGALAVLHILINVMGLIRL